MVEKKINAVKGQTIIDISNKKLGRWTVMGRGEFRPSGLMWLCRCDCGTEREVLGRSLRCGASQSCGCLQKEKRQPRTRKPRADGDKIVADYLAGLALATILETYGCGWGTIYAELRLRGIERPRPRIKFSRTGTPELTGQRFFRLTVLSKSEHGKWLCRCDCGKTTHVPTHNLVNETIKSCGCFIHKWNSARERTPRIDLTGNVYGLLTVLKFDKPIGKNRMGWLCRCQCGVEKVVTSNNLRTGRSTHCGALTHHNFWKGGRTKIKAGYISLTGTGAPGAQSGGRILEHRYVMSQYLGRPLERTETVHHKNGIRDDNRIENLELRSGQHGRGQRIEDKVADAVEYLQRYAPHLLSDRTPDND